MLTERNGSHQWFLKKNFKSYYSRCTILEIKGDKTNKIPFKARILEFGFIRAESAVMGLLRGCIGMFISIITTLFCGAVSRTQMYLSDSIVTFVNVMNCWLIPMLGSCKQNKKKNQNKAS